MESLGKVADLVPTAPMMNVGDHGAIAGCNFVVGGRLQLDHGKGPWDEWYVVFDDGMWGWVSQAQGQIYVTFPVPADDLPEWHAVKPGQRLQLAVPSSRAAQTAQVPTSPIGNAEQATVEFIVTERGGSALISAEGELPFAVTPQESGRYVDLAGKNQRCATIDFGDGSEAPTLFGGTIYGLSALQLTSAAPGPARTETTKADRLRCPQCGAPVPIRVPRQTERATCESCRSLLDYSQGSLEFLRKLDEATRLLPIPLGSSGEICGESAVVIGAVERYCDEEGVRYSWLEYLLYSPNGYRYLVENHGHHVYMHPISVADVKTSHYGRHHGDKNFRPFQTGPATVAAIWGEFNYKVELGERVETADYISPPHMLSCEQNRDELHYSLGTYVDAAEVWNGLKLPGQPVRPVGIAPAQPNPFRPKRAMLTAVGLLALLGTLMIGMSYLQRGTPSFSHALIVPRAPYPAPPPVETTTITAPFKIENERTTLEIELETSGPRSWVGISGALVDTITGEVRDFSLLAEDWTPTISSLQGGARINGHLGSVKRGTYTMRYITEWGQEIRAHGLSPHSAATPPPDAAVTIRPGQRHAGTGILAALLLIFPAVISAVRFVSFEGRRFRDAD